MSSLKTTGLVVAMAAALGASGFAFYTAVKQYTNPQTSNQATTISSKNLSSVATEASSISKKISSNTSKSINPKLLELQTKYQQELTTFATNKDEPGFVSSYNQYLLDLKNSQPNGSGTPKSSVTTTQKSQSQSVNNKQISFVKKEYTRALDVIASGKTFTFNSPNTTTKSSQPSNINPSSTKDITTK